MVHEMCSFLIKMDLESIHRSGNLSGFFDFSGICKRKKEKGNVNYSNKIHLIQKKISNQDFF